MALPEIAAVLDEQPVTITPGEKAPVLVNAADQLTKAPDTTDEENRKTAFQRSELALVSAGQQVVSLKWENTQRQLALSVMFTVLGVCAALALFGKWLGFPELQLASVVFLTSVANLVTGFYFGRTNHQRVGGVGGDAAGTR